MRNRIDIAGKKFSRLLAICPSPDYKRGHWQCLCDCGNTCFVCSSKLRSGKIKSCGCYQREFGRSVGKSNLVFMEKVDWADKDWSYLLGAMHGDGCIRFEHKNKEAGVFIPRGIIFAVGKSDIDYAYRLQEILSNKNLNAKIYKGKNGLSVVVNSSLLASFFYEYKKNSLWSLPLNISCADYVAGLIDTDGTIGKKRIAISQKSNGNLDKILPFFNLLNIEAHFYTIETTYKKNPYYFDSVTICKTSEIIKLLGLIELRHPRKQILALQTLEWANKVKMAKQVPALADQVVELITTQELSKKEICTLLNISGEQFHNVISRVNRMSHWYIFSVVLPDGERKYQIKNREADSTITSIS